MSGKGSKGQKSENLQVSRELGFLNCSSGVRCLIAAIFGLVLFICLHFREVSVDVLELGGRASRYVVAQVDFDFLDDETTAILKQEAVRDIGMIYRLSNGTIRSRRLEFEHYLTSDQEWRELVPHSTFEEMYKSMDLLEQMLREIRLTDPRTLQKMKEVGLVTKNYQVYTSSFAQTGEQQIFSFSLWEKIVARAFEGAEVHKETGVFITRYFQKQKWELREDESARRLLSKRVQAKVPDKYTFVRAGSRIINKGEQVTRRHLSMLQAMKHSLNEIRDLWHPLTLLGSLAMVVVGSMVGVTYLRANHPDILRSNRLLFLVMVLSVFTLLIAKLFEHFLMSNTINIADYCRYPLFAPFLAILLCNLISPTLAAFVSVFLTLILTIIIPVERVGFLITNVVTATVAIFSARSLYQRKEIFIICGRAWLYCVWVILSIYLYESRPITGPFFIDLFSTCIFMGITAIAVAGILPVLETTFNVLTDASLKEYMDPNNELLRKLSIEAPGTYQHSVVIGNLSEVAALEIGANALFCRVATLYHDIGKLATPQYFIENQLGGMNIHQLLTPVESARVITAHVSEGVAIARKAGLPEQFIEVIREHHGTLPVYFFYAKELERVGGDISQIDEKEFRYMGPKPRSKESAIIMITDAFEAASRALDEVNEETLTELIEEIIRERADDGQFDECLLTFEDLGIIKHTLVKTLLVAGHGRIKYPEKKKIKE